MTPTNDDIEKAGIKCLAATIRAFLLEERRINRTDNWFTIEHIADELDLRSDLIPYYLALKQLAGHPNIEAFNGRIRWAS